MKGNRTRYTLTDKGRGFIRLGGYAAEAKRKRRDLIIKIVVSVFASAVGAILGTIIIDLIYNFL